MRIVYIPTLNIAFIFFHKSGSSLLIAWMENLLRYLGYSYDTLIKGEEDDYKKLIETFITSKTKLYLFVRNPLERMITSFYWTKTSGIKSQPSQYPIGDVIEYANQIEQIVEETTDMHILPQSWELVKIINSINGVNEHSIYNFNTFRYDKRFFKDSDISVIQIERFYKNFQALQTYSASLMHYPDYYEHENIVTNQYFDKSIGILKEIFDDNKFSKMYSITLLSMFDNHFKVLPHHNNLYKQMINQLDKTKEGVEAMIKLNSIIFNESKWLGYDNSLILNTNRFI